MDDVTSLIEGLNPDQRDAVAAEDPHLLVLAGAGSGKPVSSPIVWPTWFGITTFPRTEFSA